MSRNGCAGALFLTLMMVGIGSMACGGCETFSQFEPEPGTVLVDTDANGVADAVGVDADKDGAVDLTEDGTPILDAEATASYRAWQTKNVAANTAVDAGAATGDVLLFGGIPVLGLAAGALKLWLSNRKKSAIQRNVVASVQAGRQVLGNLETTGTVPVGTLGKVDAAIRAVQDTVTQIEVKRVKADAGMQGVQADAKPE